MDGWMGWGGEKSSGCLCEHSLFRKGRKIRRMDLNFFFKVFISIYLYFIITNIQVKELCIKKKCILIISYFLYKDFKDCIIITTMGKITKNKDDD